ncbi:hypothetical protein GCM10007939_06220 [Amylibacter marinus]|uniref:SCP domain-containing protein n=2 Tax=Amylibacter marinus TaxID=1475483 RepID=A0ABQ5VT55_9RHOB|nr:hypothetical protein GCM10007939_06220 [Amylibacter marinus]
MKFLPSALVCTALLSGCVTVQFETEFEDADNDVTAQSASGGAATLAQLINKNRAAAGLNTLSQIKTLNNASLAHATDMNNNGFFSHTGSDGSNSTSRIEAYGFDGCFYAENIAKGQGSAARVMSDWMESAGHRRNVLAPEARYMGTSLVNGHWVATFSAPC